LKLGMATIGVIIIAAITLTLGLFIMYLAASWVQTYGVNITGEFDKYTQLMRAILVIEAMNYSDEKSTIYARNVSKYNISITICRIELYSSRRSLIVNATPPNGIGELAKLSRIGDSAGIDAPTCTYCEPGEELVYRIWYAPSEILEKMNPGEASSVIRILEMAFTKKGFTT